MLDTWFCSPLWPFATLGWPRRHPRAARVLSRPTSLATARDIIYLWVARMVMMGLEFPDDVPFDDVYVTLDHPGARRAPHVEEPRHRASTRSTRSTAHGADAVRFGLMAMSSSQDVRYSAEKVQQGQQFANKMWNASRLVLLNAADVEPAPRPRTVEDRWILSRLQRAIARWREQVDAYDFSHAALDLYALLLERVLRLVPGDGQAAPVRSRGGRLGDACCTCSRRRSRCRTR